MVVYFPKNGKSVCVNGIMIKRPGLPMQFPVKVYERFVEKGVLVKTPQEMDPLSPAEMQRQIELAQQAKQPIYVPEPQVEQASAPSGAPVPAGIGENYASATYKEDDGFTNEYDYQLMSELEKMGVDTTKLMKDLKENQKNENTANSSVEQVNKVIEPESLVVQKVVEPQVTSNNTGIFSSFVKEQQPAKETLTYEKALSMVKRNEDGSLKLGKDGLFVLTPGAKPYSKAEICEAINNKK